MTSLLIGLALSTFVSEDLASIGAGLLVREGHLPLTYATAACVAGVWLGDMGLWGIGRVLGRRTLRVAWLSRALAASDVTAVRRQIEVRLGSAVFVSRFVPGSRLPMYVAMGVWGDRPLAFALWSLAAVVAWTPLLVTATACFGEALVTDTVANVKTGVFGSLVVAALMLSVMKLAGRGVARLARRYHQRRAHTIEMPT
jgi:membrane protein DedA with SNARE-associated domain